MMKKIFSICAALFLTVTVFAQSPEKMSYQAVIRNSSGVLVTNTQIGVKISILQGSSSGTAVYVETQTPTSNANGLVSLEIGAGTVLSGTFASISWANGPYFVKTETDPAGGISYTITGTSQLLSVPYALHAKTAETVTGTITETDPVFGASVARGIKTTDTTYWNNKLDSYTETDPVFVASVARGIKATDTTYWNNKLDRYTETDPVFGASVARGIKATDTTYWNNKLDSYTETDPVFGASVARGIKATDTTNWNNKLDSYTETDPVFGASAAKGIKGTDTTNWNSKQDQLIAGTNISIAGNTISATFGSSNDFYLGQDTLGGIVFYIYTGRDGKHHGLIVNTGESTAQWQSSSTTTNATRSWDGVYNMGLMTGSTAKTYCQGLTTGGFTDWYLPSIDELGILWRNRFHANNALNAGSFTLLSNTANYWSSTEYDAIYAFYFIFGYGHSYPNGKTFTYNVRAVRAF